MGGIEFKGTSPILHGKKNVNGEQILTETGKLKLKNEKKDKLKSLTRSRNLQREKRQLQVEMGADTSYKHGGKVK